MTMFLTNIFRDLTTAPESWEEFEVILQKIVTNFNLIQEYGLGPGTLINTFESLDEDGTIPNPTYGIGIYGIVSAASPGALTFDLPETTIKLKAGTKITIFDQSRNCTAYTITLNPNTDQTVDGSTDPITLETTNGESVELVYLGSGEWHRLR